MSNPRQRRKQKSGMKSSGRRTRQHSSRTVIVNDPTLRAAWDLTKTVKQNFTALGLAEDVNRELGSSEMRHRMQAWQQRKAAILEECAVKRQMAQEAAEAEGRLDMTPVDLEETIFKEMNALFAKEESNGESKLIDFLEMKAQSTPAPVKRVRPLNADERAYLGPLLSKHGRDYVSMARDLKLNNMQYTPKQLESLHSRY